MSDGGRSVRVGGCASVVTGIFSANVFKRQRTVLKKKGGTDGEDERE